MFATYEQAAAHAKYLNENEYSSNVHYYPKEIELEPKQSPTIRFIPPIVITAVYAFLTIRFEDTSILDFLQYACAFFIGR